MLSGLLLFVHDRLNDSQIHRAVADLRYVGRHTRPVDECPGIASKSSTRGQALRVVIGGARVPCDKKLRVLLAEPNQSPPPLYPT